MLSRLLSVSLLLIATGILLQATLAGLFLSGAAWARPAHNTVGDILPLLAIIPTVIAWWRARAGGGVVARTFAGSVTLLFAALWIQDAFGWMTFPFATAIHVPLGVVLFWFSLHLALRAHHVGS